MEKVTLSFSAKGQSLTGWPFKFASNTVNYIEAKFELGENWGGFDSVRAVWFTDFNCISTVLDTDGVCVVPHEVLNKAKREVKVNLVGSIVENGELTDRLTTYPIKAIIIDANAKICGSETAEVTPSQFEQFVEAVKAEVAKIKDIDSVELNDDYTLTIYFSDDTETTVGPIRGEQGPAGPQGEQGETGNGIASIEKTGTAGYVDTYTITFTDGTTTTFEVRNGEVSLDTLESLMPIDTASGDIASFPDGQGVFPAKSLKVSLEPIQDLSHGAPSPENICPISGHTDVTVTVADDVDNPTVSETYTTALGRTVYGGTLDVVSGLLTVDWVIDDLGNMSWGLNANGFMFSNNIANIIKRPAKSSVLGDIICDILETVTAYSIYNSGNGIAVHSDGNLRVRYDGMSTNPTTFKNDVSGHKMCFKLATPTTYQLTPQQIQTLVGQNNVWSEQGEVEITYVADIQKYILKIKSELSEVIAAL